MCVHGCILYRYEEMTIEWRVTHATTEYIMYMSHLHNTLKGKGLKSCLKFRGLFASANDRVRVSIYNQSILAKRKFRHLKSYIFYCILQIDSLCLPARSLCTNIDGLLCH